MTVIDAIHKYDCRGTDGYKLHYENVYGEKRDLAFPLDELEHMQVKAISINLPTKEVRITLMTHR